MINTLVIYDNSGRILLQGTGIEEPDGIPFAYVDLENGEYITKMDTTVIPHKAIIFKATSELDVLKEQIENLNITIAELTKV